MKNFINFFLIAIAFIFCIYGCSEDTTTQTSTVTNKVPDKPKNPSPADSSENIDTNTVLTLSWAISNDPDGDTVKYDLYVSNTLPVEGSPIASDLSNPSYGLGIVFPSTNYYWKVTAKDNHGGSNTGNTWRFRTKNRQ